MGNIKYTNMTAKSADTKKAVSNFCIKLTFASQNCNYFYYLGKENPKEHNVRSEVHKKQT